MIDYGSGCFWCVQKKLSQFTHRLRSASAKTSESPFPKGWAFSKSIMSCSCFWLRGVNAALNGTGWLNMPGVKYTVGSISFSSSPMGFLISNTARVCAIIKKTDVSARRRPGHTLRPKPKVTSPGSGAGEADRNRSGRNSRGLGYIEGSLLNDLDIC